MKQSLPQIIDIYKVPCSQLSPNIPEQYCAKMPIRISGQISRIEHFGNASCEAEQQYEGGGYSEKTILQFNTTEDVAQYPPFAFVLTDAQGQSYVIGAKEKPYPMIEINKTIDKDTNVKSVKVSFIRRKSLVPCDI